MSGHRRNDTQDQKHHRATDFDGHGSRSDGSLRRDDNRTWRYAPDGSKIYEEVKSKEESSAPSNGRDRDSHPGKNGPPQPPPQAVYDYREVWSGGADWRFFRPGGESNVRRGTTQYYDFKDFYAKFREMKEDKSRREGTYKRPKSKQESEQREAEDIQAALIMFETFKEKKKASLAEKIQKERDALPMKAYEEKIIDAVRNNQVVLIAGDTGCGKSTQNLALAGFTRIACTQPRRIACYSLAKRVSQHRDSSKVPGRLYPVNVEYMSIAEEDKHLVDERLHNERKNSSVPSSIAAKSAKLSSEPYLKILDRIDQLVPAHERGDVLVFLSGIK
ncbi:DEAH (Asp-Glu-Ala-His) box polypeptide 34 [Gonapodya sp. JEL0774]|nr:DEAH (Asp-Glu-Ala-His) box polypeptide 34 [Gonapodya sp. JEL0774]